MGKFTLSPPFLKTVGFDGSHANAPQIGFALGSHLNQYGIVASLFLKIVLVGMVAVAGYFFWPHRSSLNAFEPAQIGELEVEVWRLAQMNKNRRDLFFTLYRIAEGQYRLPPIAAISNAWYTSDAILTFERGADRADQERALVPLQRALVILNDQTNAGYDVEVVTRLEMFAWMLSEDKSKHGQLVSAIAEQKALSYRLSAADCGPAAEEFAKARRLAREGRWSEAVKVNAAGWKRLKNLIAAQAKAKQDSK
jgi:hypothetical protein